MSTLNRVIQDLRRELSRNIQAITPNRIIEVGKDWIEFNPKDGGDIRRAEPVARTFQIGKFLPSDVYGAGGSTRQTLGDIEITFAYPAAERWEVAAQDDTLEIDTYFLKHPSSVTGVSGRWVNPLKPLRVEPSADDARNYYVLTVLCHLESTFEE